MTVMESYKDMQWERQPLAEQVYSRWLADFLARSPAAASFADRLLGRTAIRMRDLCDHLVIADGAAFGLFENGGWKTPVEEAIANPTGLFPPVMSGAKDSLFMRVESIDRLVETNGLENPVEGERDASFRRVIIAETPDTIFGAVERNGHPGFDVPAESDATRREARLALQAFRSRRREFDTTGSGLERTGELVTSVVGELGAHRSCALWLSAEREFWMRRCRGGRSAFARQDSLGVGWSNIDHHTYDGSREHFRKTIAILETLGYELREMLYAGELAGWGSQVLEQPVIGSTIFADVDLSPEELSIDFAHEELEPLNRHRRAGVLCELLGESILEAGLNHVAGLYDQRLFRALMAEDAIQMMAPFTSFPHLYQELTEGEKIAISPVVVDRLEAQGHIGADEAESLRLEGCILSHLENIERNDAYKGFNREGIDGVLRKLDPRGMKVFDE